MNVSLRLGAYKMHSVARRVRHGVIVRDTRYPTFGRWSAPSRRPPQQRTVAHSSIWRRRAAGGLLTQPLPPQTALVPVVVVVSPFLQ